MRERKRKNEVNMWKKENDKGDGRERLFLSERSNDKEKQFRKEKGNGKNMGKK